MKLSYHPATPDRWPDLERLFGARGACGGCWCMLWRWDRRADFDANKGAGNRAALLRVVSGSPAPPGVLAYAGGEAVGWCAVAPRAEYPGLGRSRILAPVDDASVWSITCLFVDRKWRRKGVSRGLVAAAAALAGSHGAQVVEAYPVEAKAGEQDPDAFVWTGLASSYLANGFEEVARRSARRPILRKRMAGDGS